MNPGALTSFPDDTIHDDYVVASSATDGSQGKMQQQAATYLVCRCRLCAREGQDKLVS
jgi:hypothetical protein